MKRLLRVPLVLLGFAGALVAQTPTISLNPPTLPNVTVGDFYFQFVSASGGSGSYNFQISSGALPPGFSIDSVGTISGTASAPGGPFSFTVRATDFQTMATGTRAYSITINPQLVITPTTLPPTTVGAVYNHAISVSGGTPPFFFYDDGGLPPGIALSSAGVLTGTPTVAGTYTPAITVQDTNIIGTFTGGSNASAFANVTIVVNPAPAITRLTLPGGTVGTSYSQNITATGGTGALTFTLGSGTLPAGLTLNSTTGILSGSPAAAGAYSFTIRARDTVNVFDDQAYTVQILGPFLITTTSLQSGTLGTALSRPLNATGGQSPYSWSISAGSLPPGITLNSTTGVIGGTATSSGTFPFTAQVSDGLGANATRALSLSILGITTSSLPPGQVAVSYNASVNVNGAVSSLVFAISAGSLPPGLAIDSSIGYITGTPTTTGDFSFTVRVTESSGIQLTAPLSIRILPQELTVTTENLPPGALNTPYSAPLAAAGGEGPYTWRLQSGSLPPGLSINSAGAITGTPSEVGTFRFQALVSDDRNSAGRLLSITIDPVALSITTGSLGPAAMGTAFSGSLAATGGVPPYRFDVAGGALPAGLTLQNNGTVSGTPAAVGNSTFRARVTDSRGQTATRDVSLNVVGSITISTPRLPPATLNVRFDAPIAAVGGTQPYTFSLESGTLPSGLALGSSGNLGGIPAQTGTFEFTVRVLDADQQGDSQAFTLSVAPELGITTESLAFGTPGTAYNAQIAAAGGVPPYSFSATGLPDGLSIGTSGAITGTPSRNGIFPAVVRVTDRDGRQAERPLSITIGSPPQITTTSLPSGTLGQNYSASVSATGGTAPHSFSVASGSLPAGVTLDSGGNLSGRPTASGTFSFSIRVTDASVPAQNATASFSISIQSPALPTVTVTGVTDTPAPGSQSSIGITLSAPAPVPLTGSSTLTFTPDAGADDPNIVFSNGQRTANFTVAQGATNVLFNPDPLGLQTGTVAGTITIVTRLFSNGVDVTPAPPPTRVLRIAPGPPVIVSASLVRSAQSLQIIVTGYAPTRQVTSASVTFVPASGANLQTAQFSVPVSSQFIAWYGSAASAPFGSQFTLTLPFNGDAGAVGSVQISLTNSQGTSNSVTAN